MSVYTLLLENNKYYVGFTNRNVNIRFQEHIDGDGSKWTRIYKPLQLINVIPGDLQTENEVTLQMMEKYGWRNVRGGSWCQVNLKYRPGKCEVGIVENLLEDFLGDIGSEIYNETLRYNLKNFLGYMKASISNIPELKNNNIDDEYIILDKSDTEICTRCGRMSHLINDCYATKDINGKIL